MDGLGYIAERRSPRGVGCVVTKGASVSGAVGEKAVRGAGTNANVWVLEVKKCRARVIAATVLYALGAKGVRTFVPTLYPLMPAY